MANHVFDTPTRVPPDIAEIYDASPMQLSGRPRSQSQLTTTLSEGQMFLQIKQDKERSTTNLAAILSLLDVQICLEKDPEILAILTGQKTTVNEIFIQKQSGKKSSFKTAEKEAIS